MYSVDDWKKRSLVMAVGAKNVMDFFGYEPADFTTRIPYIAVIDDFEKNEAPHGDIEIVISIRDGMAQKEAKKSESIKFKQRGS